MNDTRTSSGSCFFLMTAVGKVQHELFLTRAAILITLFAVVILIERSDIAL